MLCAVLGAWAHGGGRYTGNNTFYRKGSLFGNIFKKYRSTSYLFIYSWHLDLVRSNPLPPQALATRPMERLLRDLVPACKPGLALFKTKNSLIYVMSPVARMTTSHRRAMTTATQSLVCREGMDLIMLQ